jgi:hypothetical protein
MSQGHQWERAYMEDQVRELIKSMPKPMRKRLKELIVNL